MKENNRKKQGTIYEQQFVVECLLHGLEPHPTIGDYSAHDLLVSNSSGKIYKVQVKGTACLLGDTPGRKKNSTPRYRITAGSGGQKDILDCSKIDCLVCVIPGDIWYIIPCMKLKSAAVWFYPEVVNSKGYYEQFRGNWDFFLT